MRISNYFALVFAVLAGTSAAQAQTIYVDQNAPPNGDGASWNTAFRFLQDGITAASNNGAIEIRVADGRYRPDESPAAPTGTGDRNAAFQLIDGVTLRGGYAGFGATDPDLNSTVLFPTILDGDLLGNDGTDVNVNSGDNSFHVVQSTNNSTSTVLEGFNIRGGRSSSFAAVARGGGLLCLGGSLKVNNCVFEWNAGDDAGGLFAGDSDISLTNCLFRNNRGNRGGGAWIDGQGTPHVSQCQFIDNLGGAGCGLLVSDQAAADIHRCTFQSNVGQLGANGGGGLHVWGADAKVVGCIFKGNVVVGGGGGLFTLDCNPLIVNCIFRDNIGRFDLGDNLHLRGGAPRFWNCSFLMGASEPIGNANALLFKSSAEFRNCTFFKTDTHTFSVGFLLQNAHVDFFNSIIWGHRSTGIPNAEAQFFTIRALPSTVDVRNSIVEGWTGSLGGSNNSGANPLLMTSANDVLLLDTGSPAIDHGDNSLVPQDEADIDEDNNTTELLPLDLLGHQRVFNDADTPDAGVGTPPFIDIGSHEYASVSVPTMSQWGMIVLSLLIGVAGSLISRSTLAYKSR